MFVCSVSWRAFFLDTQTSCNHYQQIGKLNVDVEVFHDSLIFIKSIMLIIVLYFVLILLNVEFFVEF